MNNIYMVNFGIDSQCDNTTIGDKSQTTVRMFKSGGLLW